MRCFKVLSISTVACLLFAGSAHAGGVLYTGGVYTGAGTSTVCRVTNVGKRPIDVTVEPMDADGVAESTNTATFPVGNSSGYPGTENTRYCKFTVHKGGKKSIRATMHVSNATGMLVVLEAR
jgi:hypothetical protein